jgi:hypothetical protein
MFQKPWFLVHNDGLEIGSIKKGRHLQGCLPFKFLFFEISKNRADVQCDTLLSTDKVMPSMLARKTFVLFAIDEWVVYGIVIKSTTY